MSVQTIPTPFPRELVLASAGSGKTFRISSRIIGLLAAGAPPESVFASTFTRKAAGEILDRVLVRLARAAMDEAEARELARHARLDDAAVEAERESPAFWLGVLRRVVRELHRLSVGTLDAFFVRAATSFGHDLGLPARWGIADEPAADRLRAEALREMLAGLDEGARIELVRGLAGGEARRSVHEALAREVDQVLAVHHALDPAGPGWRALREAAGEAPADFEERRAWLAEELDAFEAPTTKAGTPDKNWSKALEKLAGAVREGAWEELLGSTLFARAMDDPDAGFNRHAIPDELVELLHHAAGLARAALGPGLALRAEAMGRLAERYAAAFDRRIRESGALRFDDVTRLLTGPEPLAARGDLHYRLDARARHLLLDEFQDTSLVQWSALEAMVDGLLGGGGAAVVVADPKQSIYGWRGAAPDVVRHVAGRYDLYNAVLAKSWRSSRVVLDAVNAIFEDVAGSEVLRDDLDRAIAAEWAEAFARHVPEKTDLPGFVQLLAGPYEGRADSQRPQLCRFAAARIRELVEAAPGRSVGVLARTNATVARLIHELRELGVDASEEGGTPLTDSAAVASVLALLRLADHPGDTLARYHVARTPVGPAVGLADPADDAGAGRVAHGLRRRLLHDGYGRTLARLAEDLADACSDRERARLRQLVELGHGHDAAATLRVSDFVRLVEAERVQAPSAAPVRVMTVHQSKGLEFDVVVLPDLDVELARRGGRTGPLAYRPTPTAAPTHAFPYLKEDVRRLFAGVPEVGAAFAQARAAELRDALSTLYVAVTRARHALHLIVPADGDSKSERRTYAQLVREALAPGVPAAEGDVLFEDGAAEWHRSLPPARAGFAAAEPPVPERIALRTPERRTRMLARRKPSAHGAGRSPRGALGLDSASGALERGSVVHAWLEAVAWLEEGVPAPEELRRIARRVAPGMAAEAVEALERSWRASLSEPGLSTLLTRASYPGDVVLERELPFLHRDGDVLLEGVMDRLVLVREGGRVARAEVVDFKTDALDSDAALLERAEHYAPQLRAYARAVAAMYRLPAGAVAAKVAFVGVGVVREVEVPRDDV